MASCESVVSTNTCTSHVNVYCDVLMVNGCVLGCRPTHTAFPVTILLALWPASTTDLVTSDSGACRSSRIRAGRARGGSGKCGEGDEW